MSLEQLGSCIYAANPRPDGADRPPPKGTDAGWRSVAEIKKMYHDLSCSWRVETEQNKLLSVMTDTFKP